MVPTPVLFVPAPGGRMAEGIGRSSPGAFKRAYLQQPPEPQPPVPQPPPEPQPPEPQQSAALAAALAQQEQPSQLPPLVQAPAAQQPSAQQVQPQPQPQAGETALVEAGAARAKPVAAAAQAARANRTERQETMLFIQDSLSVHGPQRRAGCRDGLARPEPDGPVVTMRRAGWGQTDRTRRVLTLSGPDRLDADRGRSAG